jgi:hypothetical protein
MKTIANNLNMKLVVIGPDVANRVVTPEGEKEVCRDAVSMAERGK